MFPLVAYAASPDTLDGFLGRVSQYILNPLIGLVFAAAMVYFLWGVFDFIRNNENDTDREEGKNTCCGELSVCLLWLPSMASLE